MIKGLRIRHRTVTGIPVGNSFTRKSTQYGPFNMFFISRWNRYIGLKQAWYLRWPKFVFLLCVFDESISEATYSFYFRRFYESGPWFDSPSLYICWIYCNNIQEKVHKQSLFRHSFTQKKNIISDSPIRLKISQLEAQIYHIYKFYRLQLLERRSNRCPSRSHK